MALKRVRAESAVAPPTGQWRDWQRGAHAASGHLPRAGPGFPVCEKNSPIAGRTRQPNRRAVKTKRPCRRQAASLSSPQRPLPQRGKAASKKPTPPRRYQDRWLLSMRPGCVATLLACGKGASEPARRFIFRHSGGRRVLSACKRACPGARGTAGERTRLPSFRAIFPSGGAVAGSARTRSRNQSLENPIGCRVASQCCNESRAAPTHGPPGGLRTLPQSKTQQRTPAP